MEFKWNVEEQKLRELSNIEISCLAGTYTTQEKMDAIDTYGNFKHKFTEVLEKAKLFEEQKLTIKHTITRTWSGNTSINYNTNSFKAWCRRNGLKEDGRFPFDYSHDIYIKYIYDFEDVEYLKRQVDEIFRSMLIRLRRKEEIYFKEHDSYWILTNEVTEIGERYASPKTLNGSHICFCSDGTIHVYINDDDYHVATIEELGKLKEFYKGIDKLTKEYYNTHIVTM